MGKVDWENNLNGLEINEAYNRFMSKYEMNTYHSRKIVTTGRVEYGWVRRSNNLISQSMSKTHKVIKEWKDESGKRTSVKGKTWSETNTHIDQWQNGRQNKKS